VDSPPFFNQAIQRLAYELHDEDAPALGAHTMSEFIYCARAGVIALEQQQGDDSGSEVQDDPKLGGLPTHDVTRIRQALEEVREFLKIPVAVNIGFALAILLVALNMGWVAAVLLPVQVFCGMKLWKYLKLYSILRKKLRSAESAAVAEPLWDLRQPQPIQWWSLIRAGFDSVQLQAPLMDRDLRLSGKPWRVLQRGSQHLPVLRISIKEGDGYDMRRDGRLRPPQMARLVAYAYLLNRVQHAQSDWVIVLFDTSYEGLAVPITESMLNTFADGLRAARAQLGQYHDDADYKPKPARDGMPCIRCPHGKPKSPIKPESFRGAVIAPFVTESPRGVPFHCPCGDRFRWVPPHEQAEALGLLPR
jgi:hypothetical protein